MLLLLNAAVRSAGVCLLPHYTASLNVNTENIEAPTFRRRLDVKSSPKTVSTTSGSLTLISQALGAMIDVKYREAFDIFVQFPRAQILYSLFVHLYWHIT